MNSFLDKLTENINLIDIGCSDQLQMQWKPLEKKLKYIGFEPNAAECARISNVPNNFNSSLFLPYAVAGHSGKSNIHITESYYCTSLLKPDYKWLERFEFADLFKLKSIEEISVVSLDEIGDLKNIDVDIIKCDSQGLELEILSSANVALKRAIYVETESGFHANYVNESTQAEVDLFMRQNGFILFGLLERRMPLNNEFKNESRAKAQVLWCECKWLRDLITVDQNNEFDKLEIDRPKALKYLLICAVCGIYDYGLEYAKIFKKHGLIDDFEFNELLDFEKWSFKNKSFTNQKNSFDARQKSLVKSILVKNIYRIIKIAKRLIKLLEA
jgi:FkbM family methyltransferase